MTEERAKAEAVAWPERIINIPCQDGSSDRIVGFRIPEGHAALGKYGLSEATDWLRHVTIGTASVVAALEAEVAELKSALSACNDLSTERLRLLLGKSA